MITKIQSLLQIKQKTLTFIVPNLIVTLRRIYFYQLLKRNILEDSSDVTNYMKNTENKILYSPSISLQKYWFC